MLALVFPAHSTVNSSTNRTIALGNGIQTSFTFNFIGVATAYISVLLTDSGGVQTLLTQGSGASQYTITLNAPVQGAIWGMGGTVVYNPSGAPIPAGSTLTIYRTLPLTQAINLQNLSSISVLGKGSETGLDTGVMQGQQISEQSSRAIVANIANSAAPLPLPPAAQIANKGICADGTGLNLVGCALPSSGAISTAMQPVVNAATLALGRTAFGLGTMAVENINSGSCGGNSLQDDGTGNARVVQTMVADTTNQTVNCNFLLTQRLATGPITYGLPRANTLFAGWNYTILAVSGAITVTPNASDNFRGVTSGGSVVISAGSSCTVATNAATTGVWTLSCTNSSPSLSASASANALTLTLTGAFINFRDITLTSGAPLWGIPAGNLSITIPTAATLGTSNNVPFRIWVFAAYNGGSPILGVAICSITTAIYPCSSWETQNKSGTAITSGATSAGTLYTSSAATNDSVRIIGYADYASGLGTAGTWASSPTTLQICVSGFVCKRPGDVIQTGYNTTSNPATINGANQQTSLAISFSLSASMNPVRVNADFSTQIVNNTTSTAYQISRGLGPTYVGVRAITNYNSSGATQQPITNVHLFAFDRPGTTGATIYYVLGSTSAGQSTFNGGSNLQTITVDEIMG